METILQIANRTVRLKCTAGTLIIYKHYFGKEYLDELSADIDPQKRASVAYKFVWACAKTADNNILPPAEWLESFDRFDVTRAFIEASRLFELSKAADNSDNEDDNDGESWVSHNVAACALLCGIGYSDIMQMPIGFLLSVISEYCNIKCGKKQQAPKVRKATQEDFDNF